MNPRTSPRGALPRFLQSAPSRMGAPVFVSLDECCANGLQLIGGGYIFRLTSLSGCAAELPRREPLAGEGPRRSEKTRSSAGGILHSPGFGGAEPNARANRLEVRGGRREDAFADRDVVRPFIDCSVPVPLAARALRKSPGSRVARVWAFAGAAVALVFVAIGAVRASGEEPANYRVEPVELRNVRVAVDATGTLEPARTVEVGAEVSGRVGKVLVEENARVSRGDVLAIIEADEQQSMVARGRAEVAVANASVHSAQVSLEEARAAVARIEKLYALGAESAAALESAKSEVRHARASVASARASAGVARAALSASQEQLVKATIVSPIDGIILSRMVEPGQTITAGFQTPVLFSVAQDLSTLRMVVDVDEADVGKVHAGQSASFRVEAFPDAEFTSRVVRVSRRSHLNGSVVAYTATLDVDNPRELLRPGMTCMVSIISAERVEVIAVPNVTLDLSTRSSEGQRAEPSDSASAPIDKGTKQVWVMQGGAPVRVAVEIGLSDGDYTEIVGGPVDVGSEVVVEMDAP